MGQHRQELSSTTFSSHHKTCSEIFFRIFSSFSDRRLMYQLVVSISYIIFPDLFFSISVFSTFLLSIFTSLDLFISSIYVCLYRSFYLSSLSFCSFIYLSLSFIISLQLALFITFSLSYSVSVHLTLFFLINFFSVFLIFLQVYLYLSQTISTYVFRVALFFSLSLSLYFPFSCS